MSESAGVRAGFDDVAAAVVEAIRLLDPELAGKSADRVPDKRTKVRHRLRVMIDTEIDLASPENVCGWILRRGRPSRTDDDRPSYRTRSNCGSAAGTLTDGRFVDDMGDSTCPCCVSSGTDDPPQHLFAGARRKTVPVASSLRLPVQRRLQVKWFLEVFDLVENRPPTSGFRGSNGTATSSGHEATRLHIGCAFAVESGPGTLASTRREQLQIALFVEDGVGGVDPTKADGFLDGLRVGTAWSAGGVAPGAQPHTSG